MSVPPVLFEAVCALVARDDRTPERRVFQGFGGDRFRTAIARACTAAGVPTFSPHDLRHRRISLLHLSGVPWARIGEAVGQRSLRVTSDTYTHVLVDEAELDYERMLSGASRWPERARAARMSSHKRRAVIRSGQPSNSPPSTKPRTPSSLTP